MTTVTGVTSTGTTSGTTASTPTAPRTDQFDQETFLKLLVAQLKYQDPESPTDATQFVAQTAQFAMVERLNAVQKLDEQLVGLVRSQSAAGLVGRTITWTDAAGDTRTGAVTAVTQGTTPSVYVGTTELSLDQVTGVVSLSGT
jgi:flagellar basal-body rod modification protein FlgD